MKVRLFTVLIILLLGVVLPICLPEATSTKLKMGVVEFFHPVLKIVSATKYKLTGTWQRIFNGGNLMLEKENLYMRTIELELYLSEHEELVEENKRLRKLLDFSNQERWKLQGAKVIGRDAGHWWRSILINAGSIHGVEKGMAVVKGGGLVGSIIEVSPHTSRARLITDRLSNISAYLKESREPGILQGATLPSGISDNCLLTFVSRKAKLTLDTEVLTSSLSGKIPSGLPVGRVNS